MFDNAGAKVKNYAKWLFWITIIGVICLALVFSIEVEYDKWGDKETEFHVGLFAIILLVGTGVAYVEALFLAAFGELVMNTRATADNTAKMLAMQADNAGAIANSQNNYSGATVVVGKHSASARKEPDVGEASEASSKFYCDFYWELEKSLQFTSDKGCRDYLANKVDGMNGEAMKIFESKLKHYMQFDNPVGIRSVVREILDKK